VSVTPIPRSGAHSSADFNPALTHLRRSQAAIGRSYYAWRMRRHAVRALYYGPIHLCRNFSVEIPGSISRTFPPMLRS
jgi:hypothetical protein